MGRARCAAAAQAYARITSAVDHTSAFSFTRFLLGYVSPNLSAAIISSSFLSTLLSIKATRSHSPWLSVSGEVVTYLAVIAFYFTKHRIFELLETVCIAALCSVHLIRSRNKHLDHERELQEELTALKHSVRGAAL